MAKTGRLAFRTELSDKRWFEQYAKTHGGMSRVFCDFIRHLRRQHGEFPEHVKEAEDGSVGQ